MIDISELTVKGGQLPLKIDVTADDVGQGKRHSCDKCPVARAVTREVARALEVDEDLVAVEAVDSPYEPYLTITVDIYRHAERIGDLCIIRDGRVVGMELVVNEGPDHDAVTRFIADFDRSLVGPVPDPFAFEGYLEVR